MIVTRLYAGCYKRSGLDLWSVVGRASCNLRIQEAYLTNTQQSMDG